jgi:hypothetical protein
MPNEFQFRLLSLHLLNIDDVVVDDENEVKNIADIFMSHTACDMAMSCDMQIFIEFHGNFFLFIFLLYFDFLRDWICMANLLNLFVMPYYLLYVIFDIPMVLLIYEREYWGIG